MSPGLTPVEKPQLESFSLSFYKQSNWDGALFQRSMGKISVTRCVNLVDIAPQKLQFQLMWKMFLQRIDWGGRKSNCKASFNVTAFHSPFRSLQVLNSKRLWLPVLWIIYNNMFKDDILHTVPSAFLSYCCLEPNVIDVKEFLTTQHLLPGHCPFC